jgi:hypothetical protein
MNAAKATSSSRAKQPTAAQAMATARTLAGESAQALQRKAFQAIEAPLSRAEHDRRERPSAFRGVTVRDHTWGGIFAGSRAALVRAGLMPAKGGAKGFDLPINWTDGFFASIGTGTLPPRWRAGTEKSADGKRLEVHVSYNMKDNETLERAYIALAELDNAAPDLAKLRGLIADIPAQSVGVTIPAAIKQARKWGRA